MFKSSATLDKFYNLLVQDLAVVSDGTSIVSTDQIKQAMEVAQTFKGSSSLYSGYLSRVLAKIIFALFLLAVLLTGNVILSSSSEPTCIRLCTLTGGIPKIGKDWSIYCNVYGYGYECAGIPLGFYLYTLMLVIIILMAFLVVCFVDMFWLTISPLRKLGRY